MPSRAAISWPICVTPLRETTIGTPICADLITISLVSRPGRVEDLVAAVDAVQPHPAGDRVDRVVAADVLDEGQHLAPARNSAQPCTEPADLYVLSCRRIASSSPCRACLADARRRHRRGGQLRPTSRSRHQVAEHRALAAAGGDDALGGLLVEALDAGAGLHRRRVDVPVDGDRVDVVAPIDQALVAQIAEHEQLGRSAERHQRDELALVDEDRQRRARRGSRSPLAPYSSRRRSRRGSARTALG